MQVQASTFYRGKGFVAPDGSAILESDRFAVQYVLPAYNHTYLVFLDFSPGQVEEVVRDETGERPRQLKRAPRRHLLFRYHMHHERCAVATMNSECIKKYTENKYR